MRRVMKLQFLIEQIQHMPHGAREQATNLINWAAVGTAAGVFFDWLPNIAALFSIVWLGLQIYTWTEKRRKKDD